MRLVGFRSVLVTGAAALATGIERLLELTMRHGVAIDMTVEAVETIMHRVRDVVGKRRPVSARLVTVSADRAVYRLVFLFLGPSETGTDQKLEGDGDGNEKGSFSGN